MKISLTKVNGIYYTRQYQHCLKFLVFRTNNIPITLISIVDFYIYVNWMKANTRDILNIMLCFLFHFHLNNSTQARHN